MSQPQSHSIPVEGTVTGPTATVILSAAKDPEALHPANSGLNLSASEDTFYTTTPPSSRASPGTPGAKRPRLLLSQHETQESITSPTP